MVAPSPNPSGRRRLVEAASENPNSGAAIIYGSLNHPEFALDLSATPREFDKCGATLGTVFR